MEDLIRLGDSDFRFIAGLMYSNFGIHLGEQKRTLIAGRLGKRIRSLGLSSFPEYLNKLRSDPTELTELADRLSTNHTFFFRESEHFRFLDEEVLVPLAADPAAGPPRIWSAGCASGEEAYTIAMLVRERFGPRVSVRAPCVLATDISMQALRLAVAAEYPAARIKELPAKLCQAYLEGSGPDAMRVCDGIRSMVLFKKFNLMDGIFPFKEKFQAIFCRNVMIYFNQESRRKVIDSFHRWVAPGGYLFLGHSETIPRAECPFEYVKPAVYRRSA
jgi:chemotaxis protein methyltransferase CheR